jgi:5-methylthioribose kinase
MNATDTDYAPLTVETLATRLGAVAAVTDHLGRDTTAWRSREVGDGNLNLVFIVQSDRGAVIVKQALPYVRLVGDSWPLPLKRAYFEYHALVRQGERAPGCVPEIYHFDETQALIVMQFFTPHVILRQSLMAGRRHAGLADVLGDFCARTLFRGSDLGMKTTGLKADVALFTGNAELCDITEQLIFDDPYYDAERNHHTPGLDPLVARLRSDDALKLAAQQMKAKFCTNGETMLHGDLHTGSVMVSDGETKVIDPEFVLYGPMGFDIGMLLANFWMAYFAQPGHAETPGARAAYQEWILQVNARIWGRFRREFTRLWHHERCGILYPDALLAGQRMAAEQALDHRLADIWRDMLGFAGVEMIRRTLSLAHIAENDSIADENMRASCEARGLEMGRHLLVNRRHMAGIGRINDLARRIGRENWL